MADVSIAPEWNAKKHCISNHNDVQLSDSFLANVFNNVFVNLVTNTSTTDVCGYIEINVEDTICLDSFTEEVRTAFRSVNDSNSCDADDIKYGLFYMYWSFFLQYPADNFIICLKTASFPKKL